MGRDNVAVDKKLNIKRLLYVRPQFSDFYTYLLFLTFECSGLVLNCWSKISLGLESQMIGRWQCEFEFLSRQQKGVYFSSNLIGDSCIITEEICQVKVQWM